MDTDRRGGRSSSGLPVHISDGNVLRGLLMIIPKAYKDIVFDDQGYSIVANWEGVMFELGTPTRCLRSFISTDELFNISQTFEREVMNSVIIDELTHLHDQFFEEV